MSSAPNLTSGDKDTDLAGGPAFGLLNRLNNRSLVELAEEVVRFSLLPYHLPLAPPPPKLPPPPLNPPPPKLPPPVPAAPSPTSSHGWNPNCPSSARTVESPASCNVSIGDDYHEQNENEQQKQEPTAFSLFSAIGVGPAGAAIFSASGLKYCVHTAADASVEIPARKEGSNSFSMIRFVMMSGSAPSSP